MTPIGDEAREADDTSTVDHTHEADDTGTPNATDTRDDPDTRGDTTPMEPPTASDHTGHARTSAPTTWRSGLGTGRIGVLRMGHRPGRDKRITTHVCLTARTFGADVVYVHEPDPRIQETVDGVTERFGGPFETVAAEGWRGILREWKQRDALVVHLTMYGMPLDPEAATIRTTLGATDRDLLIVLGAEKVPFEVYEAADHNVAVGNQPHSEVAALALLLDRITAGEWTHRPFHGKVRVEPRPRGKEVNPVNDQG